MPLQKADLHAGMIVWLRKYVTGDHRPLPNDHHGQTNEHRTLGIEQSACNRPVAIIDTMPENEHRVWVCQVSIPYPATDHSAQPTLLKFVHR